MIHISSKIPHLEAVIPLKEILWVSKMNHLEQTLKVSSMFVRFHKKNTPDSFFFFKLIFPSVCNQITQMINKEWVNNDLLKPRLRALSVDHSDTDLK